MNTYILKYGLAIDESIAIKFDYIYNKVPFQILLSEKSVEITYQLKSKKKIESALTYKDVYTLDAIRKASLLHVLYFGYYLEIKNFNSTFLENDIVIEGRNYNEIQSLLSSNKYLTLEPNWKNNVIGEKICNKVKSNYNGYDNALFVLIMAKSVDSEIQKLEYLWKAVNALYRMQYGGNCSEKRCIEHYSLQHFGCNTFDIGKSYFNISLKEDKIVDNIFLVMKDANICFEESKEEIYRIYREMREDRDESDLIRDLLTHVKNGVDNPNNIAPKTFLAFLILMSAYKSRCQYMHNSSYISLVYFEKEWKGRTLRIVNILLEAFVEEMLLEHYIETE